MTFYTLSILLCCLGLVFASSPQHGIRLDARGYEVLAPAFSSNPSNTLMRRDLPTGTCNAATPCVNGACCGTDNLCGYSDASCGTGCQHNCDAKAECGPYAPSDSQKCPLNVCCSEFGFCGSTTEFCTWENTADPKYSSCNTAYGGCGDVDRPSCGSGGSVSKRTIGYYESWSNTRKSNSVAPEDLNLDGFTHINFAFSFFDPSTFEITSMDSNAASLYDRFTALKEKKNGLQAWISVGGWSFTDPGPTQTAFSDMASTSANRAKFINNLKQFMDTYGFDGIDLDWEYPGADDRGGGSADSANYVLLAQDLRTAFDTQYGISMTLPTSFWYLQHFDLPGIQKHIDWFNLMAYDLHGVWDKASKFVGPYVAPHTNITEIDLGLDLLWRAGVTPDMVVLGQGWYGRSFTLADPSCNVPNGVCQFTDAGKPGPSSNAAGILDDQEISDVISQNNLEPVWDKTAGVKWITWDSDQWISYDDIDTFKQKRDFGNERCLGGLMVWAMDQADQSKSNGLSPDGDVTTDQQNNAQQMSDDQQAKLTCRSTDCDESCPIGTTEVAETNGQPGQLSTSNRCAKNMYRRICCDDGTTQGKCQWRGYRGAGLSCISGCADGETELATSTNNHDKKQGDQNCNGGLQSYCCSGFKPAPSKKELEKKAVDAAKSAAEAAAEAAAEQAALDVAAKAFCRVAVPALLAPLELLEDLIPIIGEILDIAELAATPALIQGCVKGIEKEGKAEFKVFGKEHSLSMDKPTVKPSETRPPMSSHTTPKTSTSSCNSVNARDLELFRRAPNCGLKDVTSYTATTTHYTTIRKVCDGGSWPQACMHYSSVIREYNNPAFNPVTCSDFVPARNFMQGGTATAKWGAEHLVPWRSWMRRNQKRCQRDEWPPQHFWQGDPGQIIRYNHLEDNTGAGSLWNGFCPEHADASCEAGSEKIDRPAGRRAVTTSCKQALTLRVMSMDFEMEDVALAQLKDDGLSANECYPQQLVNDPTFAILNEDLYFARNGRAYDPQFGGPIPQALIGNQSPPFKRDLQLLASTFAIDDGNSSLPLTDEQLEMVAQNLEAEEHFRMLADQMEAFAVGATVSPVNSIILDRPEAAMTAPSAVVATETLVAHLPSQGVVEPFVVPSRSRLSVVTGPLATSLLS